MSKGYTESKYLGQLHRDKIKDANLTHAELIALLNRRTSAPITAPTFYKRLKDQNWIYKHVQLFRFLGIWEGY